MCEQSVLFHHNRATEVSTLRAIVAFRALRIILGALATSELIAAVCSSIPQDTAPLFRTSPQLLQVFLNISAKEPSITVEVLQEVWSCIGKRLLQLPGEHGASGPHEITEHSLLEFIAHKSVDFVLQNDENLQNEISFTSFVKGVTTCQFMSQSTRVEMWLRSVLCDTTDPRWFVKDIFPKPEHRNVHSLHLLSFLRTASDPRAKIDVPSYTFIKQDSSISLQELLSQQCAQVPTPYTKNHSWA